jgi:poly(A) polymerase
MKVQLKIDNQTLKLFAILQRTAYNLEMQLYAVGGFVRDLILGKKGKDIDFVVIGDALRFVEEFHKRHRSSQPVLYPRFSTAMLEYKGYKLEFVSAREEAYQPDSRKPTVKKTDLFADLSRRDFTVNTLAIDISAETIGTVIDPYNGRQDLKAGILRTPLAPEKTFSDDPLRMMRAIRFATTLGFSIENNTYSAIKTVAQRLSIISQERVTEEFNKILSAPEPSSGITLLAETGLLDLFLPELSQTKGIEQKDTYHHKDVFNHTLQVVDQLAQKSEKLPLRLSALLHDIAKPATKRFDAQNGWTFHGHEIIGERMAHKILNRMKYPLQTINYVKKLIRLHLRPMALVSEEVTDSAIRRLLFLAGEDFDDLMLLCRADITSKNPDRVKKYLQNYEIVLAKAIDLEQRDRLRTFKSPVDGNEIMELFNLKPGPQIGRIKKFIEEAILEGQVANDHDQALAFLVQHRENIKQ